MSVRRLVAVDVEYECELAVCRGVLDVVRADVEVVGGGGRKRGSACVATTAGTACKFEKPQDYGETCRRSQI